MKDLPNPFWAALFILMACVLAIVALVHPNVANAKANSAANTQ